MTTGKLYNFEGVTQSCTRLLQLETSNFEGVLRRKFYALSRDTSGLLQQKSSNFEGVMRRKFAAVGHRFASVRFLAS